MTISADETMPRLWVWRLWPTVYQIRRLPWDKTAAHLWCCHQRGRPFIPQSRYLGNELANNIQRGWHFILQCRLCNYESCHISFNICQRFLKGKAFLFFLCPVRKSSLTFLYSSYSCFVFDWLQFYKIDVTHKWHSRIMLTLAKCWQVTSIAQK